MLKKTKAILALAVSAALSATILCSCGPANSAVETQPSESSFSYPFILPNTYIGDVDVGGLGKADAMEKLQTYYDGVFVPTSVTTSIMGRTFIFNPAQTFELLDVEALVDAAYEHGRTGDDKADYDAAQAGEFRIEAQTVVEIDYDDLDIQIDRAMESLADSVVSTTYEISDDAILITRGEPEVVVDVDALAYQISDCIETGVTETTYEAQAGEIQELDIQELYDRFTTVAQDAAYDPDTLEIIDSVQGRTFDLESAISAYSQLDYGESCSLPIIITEPEFTAETLGDRLFFDLLGSCDSTLEGSTSGRKNNLTLVCEAINGTVLQPGETFSFNGIVGERTAEKGYQAAGVYIGGQTQDQLGGGICQAASTIYLASMRANLEVVERYPHDYLVTYVPMGCDATIYWGVYDYKFKNTTAFPLRIDSWVADNYVHVELWGTNITGEYAEITYEQLASYPYGYVTVEDPTQDVGYSKITTYPYTGYSVDTYRNVYDRNGNLLSTTFEVHTNYKTRDQVTTVGTKVDEPEPPEVPAEAPVEASPEPLPELTIGAPVVAVG